MRLHAELSSSGALEAGPVLSTMNSVTPFAPACCPSWSQARQSRRAGHWKKYLLPVDDEIIAIAYGARPDCFRSFRREVPSCRASRSLRPRPFWATTFASAPPCQRTEHRFDQVSMDEKARSARAGPPQLSKTNDVEQVIETHPAIFLGNGTAESPARRPSAQRPRNDAVLFPLGVEGHDLAVDEALTVCRKIHVLRERSCARSLSKSVRLI